MKVTGQSVSNLAQILLAWKNMTVIRPPTSLAHNCCQHHHYHHFSDAFIMVYLWRTRERAIWKWPWKRGIREREVGGREKHVLILTIDSSMIATALAAWSHGTVEKRERMWPLANPGPAKQRGQFVTSHTDNSLSSTPARISMCSKTCLFIRLMGGERVTAGKLTYMACK